MTRKITVITVILLIFCLIGCGEKFNPQPVQKLTKLEVYENYDPYNIISVSDDSYSINIVENNIDITSLGSYTITYRISRNDKSEDFSYTVAVADTTKPELTMIKDYYLSTGDDFEECFSPEEHFTATDNYDGNITSKVTYSGSVNTYTAGAKEVEFSVTDSSGNKTVLTALVYVEGTTVTESSSEEENSEKSSAEEDDGTLIYLSDSGTYLYLYENGRFTIQINDCDETVDYQGDYGTGESQYTLYLDYPLIDGDPESDTIILYRDGNTLSYEGSLNTCSLKQGTYYTKQ